MAADLDDRNALTKLEDRLRTLLPEQYQDTYEDVQPVSMGSAGLKYGLNGKVAWGEMWDTFCDLAMAGGPPHKGSFLEAASQAEIDAQPDRYLEVLDEICRGLNLVTNLVAQPSPNVGWVRVECDSEAMAKWLLRAIVMENISVRREGVALDLPVGPDYRLDKEIKNVITVIAKTWHYWDGHIGRTQQRAIADLLSTMDDEAPLVEPPDARAGLRRDDDERVRGTAAEQIHRDTGLHPSNRRYDGWLGVECPGVGAAVWMMRMMIALNVLSRREGTVLYVPVNPLSDPKGEAITRSVVLIHRLAAVKGLL